MVLQWNTSLVYWTGVAALIPQAYLNIMSIGPIRYVSIRKWGVFIHHLTEVFRNYCYEFFKATHYIAVILFSFFFWVHCDFRLSSWDYFIAAAVLYFCSLVFSTGRSIFSTGIHHAHLELTNPKSENGLVRITILTALRWKPGQHIFVRFLTAGVHAATMHPFSICSLPDKHGRATDMVFYIKPKSGFTARLARMAASGSANAIPVLLDGPYGGPPTSSFTGYEQVLLIAGGSGAGFLLPLLEDLIRCTCHIDESIRMKVHLVLAVRKAEEADWFKSAVKNIVHGDVCTCNIHISVYITGDATKSLPLNDQLKGNTSSTPPAVEQNSKDESKPVGKAITDSEQEVCGCDEAVPQSKESAPSSRDDGETIETSRIITSYSSSGRPNLPKIISTSVASHKSIAIVGCGPKSMLFDVRNSAAAAQFREGKGKDVYLHTESFSW
jgi:ferric-chelate reductase